MKQFWTVLVGFACVLALNPAHADYIAPCPVPAGIVSVPLPGGLPPALRKEFGDIALPNQDFDATDVELTGRNVRFIFVWNKGSKWLVATEHGGIGYYDLISAYDLSKDFQTASKIADEDAFPPTVCRQSQNLVKKMKF